MCTCIPQLNQKLEHHNTVIEMPIFGPQLPFVSTIKKPGVKKRCKPVRMFASFCPFCGEKYEEIETVGWQAEA